MWLYLIIKNYATLGSNRNKKIVLQILETGLSAALPKGIMGKIIKKNRLVIGKNTVSLSKYDRVFVVAFGKAADSMTKIVDSLTTIKGGIVVIPKGVTSTLKNNNFKIIRAGHPVPDQNSVLAAKKIIEFLSTRNDNDFVIFLISGGGSSLVTLPDGITLSEKKKVTRLLLNSGANINEINCVRKHLSKIKGGRMAEFLKCGAVSLVMSDVVRNDLTIIASGMTYFDKTTFGDAAKILKKYRLEKLVSKNVLRKIKLGMTHKIPETPKRAKIRNHIIATNEDCLNEMARKARYFGFRVKVLSSISGDVRLVARKFANVSKSYPCVIFGGETTVKVTGNGKGGRNQELVLYTLIESYKKNQNILIGSIGTDGKDGNSNACGAIMDNSKLKIDQAYKFLKNNDSYTLLKEQNALIFTGSTHTNLMDIGIILRR